MPDDGFTELSALDKIRSHMRVIRGAQYDILHGRPAMDSEDEISASLRGIEEVLHDAECGLMDS